MTYVRVETGPLSLVIDYYNENPEDLIFGKGMMYTFETRHYDLVQIYNYETFTDKYTQESSDFYILNFFEQFGVFGILLIDHQIILLIDPSLKEFHKNSKDV